MRILGSKKRFAAVATTTAAVLLGSGIAVAYWTTGGSGSGTADIGTSQDVTFTVGAGDGIDDLYPGAAEVFEVDVNNPTDGALQLGTVDIEIDGFSAPAGTCDIDDFSVTDIVVNDEVPAGPSTLTGTATISMDNTASNQDDCKNASLDLSFTS
jgi:hypothetical protein